MQAVVKQTSDVSVQPAQPEPWAASMQPAAVAGRAVTARSTPVSVSEAWRDTFAILGAHSSSILILALLGFAAATLLSAALSLAMFVYAQAQASGSDSGPLATLFAAEVWKLHLPELVSALVGAFALAWGRGAIAWIALRSCEYGKQTPHRILPAACRAGFDRMPALVISSLIYGLAITAAQVGMTPLFSQISLDPPIPRQMGYEIADLVRRSTRTFVWEGESVSLPDPGAPFTDLLPHVRQEVFGYSMKLQPQRSTITRVPLLTNAPAGLPEFWLITLTSFALALAGELLLRFRTVMIMRSDRTMTMIGIFAPLIASAHFSLKHFKTVFIHIGLLRLVFFAMSLAFIVLPTVVVLNFLIPRLQQVTLDLWVRPTGIALVTSSIALVTMLPSAFGVVYDARLYAVIEKTQLNNPRC